MIGILIAKHLIGVNACVVGQQMRSLSQRFDQFKAAILFKTTVYELHKQFLPFPLASYICFDPGKRMPAR